MRSMKEDNLGFLITQANLKFGEVEIIQHDTYVQSKEVLDKYIDQRGFCYPTESRDNLFKINPSHKVLIRSDKSIEELRFAETGFIMYLLGYLYGCRLQFHDWWFDSGLPMYSQHNVSLRKNDAEDFLGSSFEQWKRFSPEKQKALTNLLYMHVRNSSYFWDWERFMMEYIVFDGIWKIFDNGRSKKRVPHKDRIKEILCAFSMFYDEKSIGKMVELRNGLLHESLWDGQQPGTAASREAFFAYIWIKKINQRLIPALLAYKTEYIKSNWTSIGTFSFKI